MKWMLISIFLLFFVGAPMYLLNTFVMPDLLALKNVYSHADQRATAVIAQPYNQNLNQN